MSITRKHAAEITKYSKGSRLKQTIVEVDQLISLSAHNGMYAAVLEESADLKFGDLHEELEAHYRGLGFECELQPKPAPDGLRQPRPDYIFNISWERECNEV